MTLDFPNMKWEVKNLSSNQETGGDIPADVPLPDSTADRTICIGNQGSFYGPGNTIYRSTIYSYGELVQDLVPALDPKGTPCLYDLVTKTPVYDTGTTPGVFEVGPIVC